MNLTIEVLCMAYDSFVNYKTLYNILYTND